MKKQLDKENFIYDNILHVPEESREGEVMQTFLEMYYATTTSLPKEIYLQAQPTNEPLIKTLLESRLPKNKKSAKIKFSVPTRGQKLNLIKLG